MPNPIQNSENESQSHLVVKENNPPTIFSQTNLKPFQEAFDNLVKGKTPASEIQERDGRAGLRFKFVNTYYMTRQISLLTGFRWTSEYLDERFYPNEQNPRECGVKVKVTIYDQQGKEYSHTIWGQKDIAKYSKDDSKGTYKAGDPISIFDDLKAAYSDGIKKCLSYFGIANDIYGGKEIEYFSEDEETTSTPTTGNDASRALAAYVDDKKIRWSKVFEILNIESYSEIKDYKAAYFTLKNYFEGGDVNANKPQSS